MCFSNKGAKPKIAIFTEKVWFSSQHNGINWRKKKITGFPWNPDMIQLRISASEGRSLATWCQPSWISGSTWHAKISPRNRGSRPMIRAPTNTKIVTLLNPAYHWLVADGAMTAMNFRCPRDGRWSCWSMLVPRLMPPWIHLHLYHMIVEKISNTKGT